MATKVWMFLLAMTLPDVSPKVINDTVTVDPENDITSGSTLLFNQF